MAANTRPDQATRVQGTSPGFSPVNMGNEPLSYTKTWTEFTLAAVGELSGLCPLEGS